MNIDTRQLKKFANNLIKIRKTSFPQIMNNVITTTTYEISNTLKKETIPKTFIKRNNFAPMSIRYNRVIGYNMNTMFGMVGQIQNAGQNNAKTMLEQNEKGEPIQSKSKHTTIGLKNIRTNNTFSKTIKKDKRITNLDPVPAQNILRNFRYNSNTDDKTLELTRLAGLIVSNKIKTLNKPLIARTKNNKLGIYSIKNSGDGKVKIEKLYSMKDKTTNIKKREWLKPTYEKQMNNLDRIYTRTAKAILDRNARAFKIEIRE